MVKKKDGEELSDDRRDTMLQDIHRKLTHVRSRQDKVNESLDALQDFSERGGSVCIPKNRIKSKELYQTMMRTTESQVDYLRKILADIERIRKSEYKNAMRTNTNRAQLMKIINHQGTTLPLYVSGVDGFPPPGVGGVFVPETTPLLPGDSAAAYADDNWILAEVVAVTSTGKYDMRDVDSAEQKVRLTVPRRRLIPLPKWRADPQKDAHALFPLEAIVLALYPQTTCFYKGVIVRVPPTATDDYHVAFEDPSYSTGYSPALPIPQRYVVQYKEIKSKKRKEDEED